MAFGPEGDTWARFALDIDNECITCNEPSEGFESAQYPQSEFVEGALSGIAEWVVENWEFVTWEARTPFPRAEPLSIEGARPAIPGLREAAQGWLDFALNDTEATLLAGWQHRHTLGHGTTPIALPSIVFVPELRHVLIAIDGPPPGFGSSVRFRWLTHTWPALFATAKEDLKEVLASVVDAVLARAAATDRSRAWAEWLGKKWLAVQQVERDPGVRRRHLLGAWLAERWEEIERAQPETASSVYGVAVDSAPIDNEETLHLLLEQAETARSERSVGRWQQLIRAGVDTARPLHEQGYLLARRVRKLLGRETEPFVDLRAVLAELDIRTTDPLPIDGFRTAVVGQRRGSARIMQSSHDPRMESVAGCRFALSAALGRLVSSAGVNGAAAFGAAHGDSSRIWETRRANAFAAEFILPADALRKRFPSRTLNSVVNSDLSEEYGISRQAAAWHAWNHGFRG
jgi:hypothetical protein